MINKAVEKDDQETGESAADTLTNDKKLVNYAKANLTPVQFESPLKHFDPAEDGALDERSKRLLLK